MTPVVSICCLYVWCMAIKQGAGGYYNQRLITVMVDCSAEPIWLVAGYEGTSFDSCHLCTGVPLSTRAAPC